VTTELNIHLEIKNAVPTKTVQQVLHKSNIHSRAAIAKPPITERLKRWCDDHKT
jgi:hypothetical protein